MASVIFHLPDLGWSYRHAWGYLKRAERMLGGSLLLHKNGKGLNRGAVLLPLAREIVRYRRVTPESRACQ